MSKLNENAPFNEIKKKQKRNIGPEQLEKLKLARAKANEVRKANYEARKGDIEKLKELKKVVKEQVQETKKLQTKEEIAKLESKIVIPIPKESVAGQKEEVKKNIVDELTSSEEEEVRVIKKDKTKKKKKRIIYKYESDSDSEDEIIIKRNRRKDKKEGSSQAFAKQSEPIPIPTPKPVDPVQAYLNAERLRMIRKIQPWTTWE